MSDNIQHQKRLNPNHDQRGVPRGRNALASPKAVPRDLLTALYFAALLLCVLPVSSASAQFNFNWYSNPRITSVAPNSGGPGTRVTLHGENFTRLDGVWYLLEFCFPSWYGMPQNCVDLYPHPYRITFGSTAAGAPSAAYEIISSTEVLVTVPNGAVNGPIFLTRWDDGSVITQSPNDYLVVPRTIIRNDGSYPIGSLQVDGVNRLSQDLAPGQAILLDLPTGNHVLHAAAISPWYTNIYGADILVYVWDQSFSAGLTIRLTDPSIRDLLADFAGSATWIGHYWQGSQQLEMRFVFYSSGNFVVYDEAYDDEDPWASGTYTQTGSNTADISRQFEIDPAGPDPGNEGHLYEAENKFIMDIGPNNSVVSFRLQ